MGAINAELLAFNRGRISPLALARTDFKRTAFSAEIQTNWMPRTLGSMMLRPGLAYTGRSRNNAPSISIPFIFAVDDTARLEITDQTMRVWVDDELVILLEGLQTIDGVALSARDRVLVKDQANATDNGIWVVNSSDWERALDFNGTLDAVGGTQVSVNQGVTCGDTYWRVTGQGSVDIGTDGITFEPSLLDNIATASFLQSGVNAQVIPAQDEFRFRIRPEQFAGSDAQKINRAITEANARGGGIVELDAGTYNADQPILLMSNVTLRGKGRGVTIIQQTGTASAWAAFTTSSGIVTTLSANEYNNVHVEGIDVKGIYSTPIANGDGPPYAKNGISIGKARNSSVVDCATYDTATGIIIFGDVAGVDHHRNLIRHCYAYNARSWNAAGNVGAPRGITIDGNWSDVEYSFAENCYTGFYASSEHGRFVGCMTRLSTDDGIYINANFVTLLACKGEGADTRAGSSGSFIALNPARGCRIIACEAFRYQNAGLRMRHAAALAPYENIIEANHFEDCGYGILTDVTGASAWPTGIAAFDNKIRGNTFKGCQFNGAKLSRFQRGVISENTALNNNQAGVSISTRGGIGLLDYCLDNVIDGNICADTQTGAETQAWGLYSYDMADSGASVQNTGNLVSNQKTLFGIDKYYPRSQGGAGTATVLSGAKSIVSATINFPQPLPTGVARRIFVDIQNPSVFADAERPVSALPTNITNTGFQVIIDAGTTVAANRAVNFSWRVEIDQ